MMSPQFATAPTLLVEHISTLADDNCKFCTHKEHNADMINIFSRGYLLPTLRKFYPDGFILEFSPPTIGYFVLGLVRSRDGNRLGVASPAYVSLPSPNMPTADDQTPQMPTIETQVSLWPLHLGLNRL